MCCSQFPKYVQKYFSFNTVHTFFFIFIDKIANIFQPDWWKETLNGNCIFNNTLTYTKYNHNTHITQRRILKKKKKTLSIQYYIKYVFILRSKEKKYKYSRVSLSSIQLKIFTTERYIISFSKKRPNCVREPRWVFFYTT